VVNVKLTWPHLPRKSQPTCFTLIDRRGVKAFSHSPITTY
jgi:hypothetical protein